MKLLRASTRKFINILLLFSLLPIIGINQSKKISSQDSDPWQTAVSEAQVLVQNNGDLPGNLLSYADYANDINQYLTLVRRSQPILDQIDTLKGLEIPFMGNAWDLAIDAMNGTYPGSGEALKELDSILRQLISLSASLDNVNNVNAFISALNDFSLNPSKTTLLSLDQSALNTIDILSPVRSSLSDINSLASDLVSQLFSIQDGLDFGGTLLDVPLVSDFVDTAKYAISNLSSPLRGLVEESQDLENQITRDMQVMEDIHDIVYKAEHPPISDPQSGLSGIRFDSDSAWIYYLVGAVLLVGFGILLFFFIGKSSDSRGGGKTGQDEVADKGSNISQAYLVASDGFKFKLETDPLRLGRAKDCELRIKDEKVSRYHAVLRFSAGSWFIQDTNSSAGLFINGRRTQASKLQSGDQVAIGRSQFTYKQD